MIDTQQSARPQAVSEREAAQMLGVSAAGLRSWRKKQRGPAWCHLNRRVVYLLEDLRAYLAEARVAR